jgi:hypothetical protein
MLTLDHTSLKIATARAIICMYYAQERRFTASELSAAIGDAYEKMYAGHELEPSLGDLYRSRLITWNTDGNSVTVFQITKDGIDFAVAILAKAETDQTWKKYIRLSNSPNVGPRTSKSQQDNPPNPGTW